MTGALYLKDGDVLTLSIGDRKLPSLVCPQHDSGEVIVDSESLQCLTHKAYKDILEGRITLPQLMYLGFWGLIRVWFNLKLKHRVPLDIVKKWREKYFLN